MEYFTGFNSLQLCDEFKSLLLKEGETPENFTERIMFMSMFNDISCGSRENEKECMSNANLVSLYAKRFGKGQWSFIGPGSEKKWYSISEDSPQGEWDNMAERMLLEFAESGCPIFRATSPGVDSRAKVMENCRCTVQPIWKRLRLFRIIVSANQLSLSGAVAEICEEYESLHQRTERHVVMGQSSSSLVLSVVKTEVLLDCDDLANKDLLLQQCGERIEKLSKQDKSCKFCMDAGFLNVVEIGQYFMTKDTAEFSQFHAVACREYTLPREEEASEPKGGIQGNTKIGPVLEVATCCLHGKYGVEIRIWSLHRDNTHSWVRISHGSNKLVTNLNNSEQETSEVQFNEYALKLNASDFACRSKAKSKPQRRELAGSSTRTIPIWGKNLDRF